MTTTPTATAAEQTAALGAVISADEQVARARIARGLAMAAARDAGLSAWEIAKLIGGTVGAVLVEIAEATR